MLRVLLKRRAKERGITLPASVWMGFSLYISYMDTDDAIDEYDDERRRREDLKKSNM